MTDKQRILEFFMNLKGYSTKDLHSRDYARFYKRINELLERGTVEEIIAGLEWISVKDFEWTLETLDKRWLDYKKETNMSQKFKDMERLINGS